jgi:hypothetical protein
MHRLILRPSGINRLTQKVQYRVVGCYETVSKSEYIFGSTLAVLSDKARQIGSFY